MKPNEIIERLQELTDSYTANKLGAFLDEAFESYLMMTNQAGEKLSGEFRVICELKEVLTEIENLK